MKTRKNLAYFALFACLVSCSDDIGISQDEPLQKQEAEKSLELSSHEVMVLKEMANLQNSPRMKSKMIIKSMTFATM